MTSTAMSELVRVGVRARIAAPLNNSTTYIAEFDGLRGLAVIGVMLSHSRPQLANAHLDVLGKHGWIGVNLFFVLSGFLITGILVRAKANPAFYTNFYARRALRVWPLYFVVLLCSWLIGHVVPGIVAESLRATPWVPFLLLVQNLFVSSMPAPWCLLGRSRLRSSSIWFGRRSSV